jgi:hypothetical protein
MTEDQHTGTEPASGHQRLLGLLLAMAMSCSSSTRPS